MQPSRMWTWPTVQGTKPQTTPTRWPEAKPTTAASQKKSRSRCLRPCHR